MTKILDYLDEFIDDLKIQLTEDEKRWGNTWLHRSINGQEHRIFKEYDDYYDQFKYANIPIPWLKIVGNALIAWIREKHPELFEE